MRVTRVPVAVEGGRVTMEGRVGVEVVGCCVRAVVDDVVAVVLFVFVLLLQLVMVALEDQDIHHR